MNEGHDDIPDWLLPLILLPHRLDMANDLLHGFIYAVDAKRADVHPIDGMVKIQTLAIREE